MTLVHLSTKRARRSEVRAASLVVLMTLMAGCLDTRQDNPAVASVQEPLSGILLGVNPVGAPWATLPAAGSSTELYMGRIWDMGVTWAQIEPNPPNSSGVHTYNWTQLDAVMDNLAAHNMRPMYVLYGSPRWAVTGACNPNYTGNCTAYPNYVSGPNSGPDSWQRFAAAVAQRYDVIHPIRVRGERPIYEVWNEPNLTGAPVPYWTGTDDQFYELSSRAYAAVTTWGGGSEVACCGWNRLAANTNTGKFSQWLTRGGGAKAHKITYHPYPSNFDPNTAGAYTDNFRARMSPFANASSKPLWATEVGFINTGTGSKPSWTVAQQADLFARTINVLQGKGIPVVLWYPWQDLADPNNPMLGLEKVVYEVMGVPRPPPPPPPPPSTDASTGGDAAGTDAGASTGGDASTGAGDGALPGSIGQSDVDAGASGDAIEDASSADSGCTAAPSAKENRDARHDGVKVLFLLGIAIVSRRWRRLRTQIRLLR